MKKNRLTRYIAITAVCISLFGSMAAFSQEDIRTVADSAFDVRRIMRPPVRFLHDGHNEKAQIGDCNVCHHEYDEKGQKTDNSTEGTECSECHKPESPENTLPLIRAYHLQCKGCHEQSGAGPVMCGECHVK